MAKRHFKLFCKHNWVKDREVNNRGLWQCYCSKCHKIRLKNTKGDIEN